jgi:hypothetical protein
MSSRRRRDAPVGALTRWNRFCFRFWGPASIGDMSVPARSYDPDPACPRCAHPESAHEAFVTRDGKALRRCPLPV